MTRRKVWQNPSSGRNQITWPTDREGPILREKIQRIGLTLEESEFWTGALKGRGFESVCGQRWSCWEDSSSGKKGRWHGRENISWRLGTPIRRHGKGESSEQLGFGANESHPNGMTHYFSRMDCQVHSKQMNREDIPAEPGACKCPKLLSCVTHTAYQTRHVEESFCFLSFTHNFWDSRHSTDIPK